MWLEDQESVVCTNTQAEGKFVFSQDEHITVSDKPSFLLPFVDLLIFKVSTIRARSKGTVHRCRIGRRSFLTLFTDVLL